MSIVDGEDFIRVVGSRRTREIGDAPSREDRDRLRQMAGYETCAPKGVFIYASHEEANAARERWQVEAVVTKART